jgi:hypothetical protein
MYTIFDVFDAFLRQLAGAAAVLGADWILVAVPASGHNSTTSTTKSVNAKRGGVEVRTPPILVTVEEVARGYSARVSVGDVAVNVGHFSYVENSQYLQGQPGQPFDQGLEEAARLIGTAARGSPGASRGP